MTYEAWRATHQDAEAAAKAAFEQVQGLAKLVDGLQGALGRQVRFGGVSDAAAAELRRLHAENQDLRTRHYCNTAEIESLQARVQELGEMARENRSKRVIELEQRIAEMESEAEQNAKIIGASAETELALRARLEEMERELAAIGAGGVEPLRKRAAAPQVVQAVTMPAAQGLDAQTIKHISALSELVRMPNAEHFADAHNAAVRHLRALAAQAK